MLSRLLAMSLLLFLCSCATKPINEKEWIDNFVDTGEFNNLSAFSSNILLEGSINRSYSNIDNSTVINIDNDLLKILRQKYGEKSVLRKSEVQKETEIKYIVSYEILTNRVVNTINGRGHKECFISGRIVNIRMDVVSEKTGLVVWGGNLKKGISRSNCKDRSPPDTENSGFIASLVTAMVSSVVDGAFDSVFGTYPEPPKVTLVSKSIFQGFYKSMP